MELINGIPVFELPYKEIYKVHDLMEYNGPILSHYKDPSDKDYLFYWVDYDTNYNRWLVWNISSSSLYEYINGEVSLYEVFLESPLFFSIDIDNNTKYNEIKLLTFNDLPKSYIPEKDSLYSFDIADIYKNAKPLYSPTNILKSMRETGYYFALKTNTPRYGRAVKLHDAGYFLIDISQSAHEYVKNDFYNKYKGDFTDLKQLEKAVSNVEEFAEPLVVDAKFSSFEVMLSIDRYMGYDGEKTAYRNWRKDLMKNYHDDVINIDYNSKEAISKLEERFPNEATRRRIIKPVMDILVSKDYKLETRSANGDYKKIHPSISKKTYKEIIKTSPPNPDSIEKKKILNVIVEVTEKDGVISFGKKTMNENILFQREEAQVDLSVNYLNISGMEITFKQPLIYNYFIDDENLSHVVCKEFNIDLSANSKTELLRGFQKTLAETIFNYIDLGTQPILISQFIEEARRY
jgi:hypothetical protein